ncbi:Magnesium transporter MgtE [Koleobacter methoxysyntrophicus]|uniref:Magnesium transporter MgtE n=1 Tax=Koleobacter methoxysyntrophicus TaxID=2751313 RepID=A0A8A0RQX0_9FIRM|nr:magnesium transporter [Koleobacter methoxysyntrophicus]QSQ10354.1 Magnesium transporter MgtE [Koleobacter methoxysyntrophicus]
MDKSNINLTKSIKAMLKRGKVAEIKELLLYLHPADIAELLVDIQNGSQKALFKLMDYEKAAEVLDELEPEIQIDLIDSLAEKEKAEILEKMSVDEIIDLLQELPESKVEKLLKKLPMDELEKVKGLLLLSRDSAGGIMTTDYVYIPEDTPVPEAINMVRKFGREAETIYYLYIVDRDHHLVGVLSLRELISARRDMIVKDIMHKKVVSVHVDDDQEDAARAIEKYSLLAIPVVDSDQRLMGIITVDDALDVLREETTEDIHKLAGITAEEDIILTGSPLKAAQKRLPWLLICLFGDLIAGSVIKGFESTLETVIALAFFIPVLMATGGNVGTQSLALAVRGLATGEITAGNFVSYIFQEAKAGLIVGIICGAILTIIALAWQGNPNLGLVVGAAMGVALTLAALIGMIIPMILNALKIDPAVASGPFITTVVDITTLMIYFSLATCFFNLV